MAIPPNETGAHALYPFSEALARKYSLMTRYGDPYQMWRRQGDYIALPREVGPLGALDSRVDGFPIDVKFIGTPRSEEQARVYAEIRAFIGQGMSGIVQAPTGSGKSSMGCLAISVAQRKTLVLVNKQDLVSQWQDSFGKFLGLKPHEIGHLQADKVNVSGKKVVIGMIHSLAIDQRYDPQMLAEFGLVIIDECDTASADEMSKCFSALPAKLRLGLSATIKRKDGKDQVIYGHIGPVRVTSTALALTPKVMVFKTGWGIPKRVTRDKITGEMRVKEIPHQAGRIMHILKMMGASDKRNNMIGRLAAMAYAKDRKIVVFTETLDHIEGLMAQFRKAGIPSADCARYIGGMSEEAREIAKTKRVLAATWKMFDRGTDIPALDTAIFGTPKADVVQAAGRILRPFDGKKPPLIMDLVDESRVFQGYARARARWYASIGAEVINIA
jgi:superfamily II DNA or RNA helicase